MKVKYCGKSFGSDGLTNNKIYEVVDIDKFSGALRVIDDSGDDYLYDPARPRPMADNNHPGGRWEIIEDPDGDLLRAIKNVVEI